VSLWAAIYDDESKSCALLHNIHDTYFLVAIIDNDFITHSSIWNVFDELTLPKDETEQHHSQYAV